MQQNPAIVSLAPDVSPAKHSVKRDHQVEAADHIAIDSLLIRLGRINPLSFLL
jgi:hypothetical protein